MASSLTIERAIEIALEIAKSNSTHAQDNADLAQFLTEVLEMRKEVAELRKVGKFLIQRDVDVFGVAHVMEHIPIETYLEFTASHR